LTQILLVWGVRKGLGGGVILNQRPKIDT